MERWVADYNYTLNIYGIIKETEKRIDDLENHINELKNLPSFIEKDRLNSALNQLKRLPKNILEELGETK